MRQRTKFDAIVLATLTEVSIYRKSDSVTNQVVIEQFNKEFADIYK